VQTPGDLNAALLERPIPLMRNFTANLMAYAIGRRVEYFDQPSVREIARNAEAEGYRMSAFIRGVVASDAFQMMEAEAATDAGVEGATRDEATDGAPNAAEEGG
jgi:hypothetical protein